MTNNYILVCCFYKSQCPPNDVTLHRICQVVNVALLKQFSKGVVGDSYDFFLVLAGENVLGSSLKTRA